MVGFPHSEIFGSKLIRSSPKLIAAYYVLHRLHTPRHPLNALKTLDRSHYQYPQCHQHHPLLYRRYLDRRTGLLIRRIAAPAFDRSDQINQNSRADAVPREGCSLKRNNRASLYDVERSGRGARGHKHNQTCSLSSRRILGQSDR